MVNAFDLSEEELEYELRIRNMLQLEPEQKKRERLRNVFKMETQESVKIHEVTYFENEWPLAVRKLEEIGEGLKGDMHVKWISQLRHWKERVYRAKVADLAQEEQKCDILMTIRRLMALYKETARRLMNLSDPEDENLEGAMGQLGLDQNWNEKRKVQENFENNIRFHSSLATNAHNIREMPQGKYVTTEPIQQTVGDLFRKLPKIQELKIGPETARSMNQGREAMRLGAIPKDRNRERAEQEAKKEEKRGKKKDKQRKTSRKHLPKKSSSEDESSSLDSLSSLLSSVSSSDSELPESSDRWFVTGRRDDRFQHYRLDRWGIQFSGDAHGMDVSDFVFQVNELIVSERIPNDRFLDQAYILFSGEARRWYFTYKKKYKTWNDFSKHLKIRFGDPNKDRKLLQEIKDRRQKKGESFVAFCSEIEGMFERMTKQYSERKRLKVLRNNMRRWYKTKLTFYKIKNIAHLNMLCQQLDKDSGRIYSKSSQPFKKHVRNVEATSESSTSSSEDAEVCAFERRGKPERKDRVKHFTSTAAEVSGSRETLKEPVALCWNCRKYGHRWRDCKLPKVIFCHACGTPGVTFFTCPKSHKLPQQNSKNESSEEN